MMVMMTSAATPATASAPMVVMIPGWPLVFRIIPITTAVSELLPMVTAESVRAIASGVLTVAAAAALGSSSCSTIIAACELILAHLVILAHELVKALVVIEAFLVASSSLFP